MKYYTINEEAAARAKEMYSWFEYKHGTKTAEYKSEVDEAYSYAEALPEKEKIKKLASSSNIIKSSDSDAIDKLKAKIEKAEKLQATMKAVNAYFRKHGTLKGYGDGEYDSFAIDSLYGVPYPPYCLTNNNAKIRSAKQRIKELEEEKASTHGEDIETEIEGLKIVENTEAMRIQLIFDDKPSAEVRDVLKSNGFRWSPKFAAWQRHLNSNGKYAVKKVLEILKDTAKEG